MPLAQKRACGDAYLPVAPFHDFELRIHHRGIHRQVRRGSQLTRFQATYRLGEFYLPMLRDPPPGLRFLATCLRQFLGKSRISLVLETEIRRGSAGYFRHGRRHGRVHLFDTLSTRPGKPAENGIMDAATLYHELGHSLMFYLYGRKMPNYGGHPGHDTAAENYGLARTNPGAAWAEGFAGAIANLDYHSSRGIYSPQSLPEAWFRQGPEERLSNEFVISAALTDYLKSVLPAGEGQTRVVWDAAAERRLTKVLLCMQGSGMQENFSEFLRDFFEIFPEEGARLRPILRAYGLPVSSNQKTNE